MNNDTLDAFRNWIQTPSGDYRIKNVDNNFFSFYTDYAVGEVNIYPEDIVEMRIMEKKTGETRFFLHFAFSDLNRAKELFGEMQSVMNKLRDKSAINVLLTCTSALTTSYFAQKLNQTAKVLDNNMQFSAVDINQLYQKAFDYDLVLLAPQVGYMYEKAKSILKNVKVCRIPPEIFGTYDCDALIRFAREKLQGRKVHGEEEGTYIRGLKSRYQILAVPVVINNNEVHIGSFIFDHGDLMHISEVIKETITYEDIEDVIKDTLASAPDVQGIGISLPGIVNQGVVALPELGMDRLEMEKRLQATFHLPAAIDNDVNAAALGCDSQQNEYKTILYHFQPRGAVEAGQGLVLNHHLHHGHRGVSGEVKYLMNDLKFSKDPEELAWQPEGMLEIVEKLLLAAICISGPDLICIHSDLTPDVQAIRQKLAEKIPDEYLPEFRYVANQEEYMAVGAALLCAQTMDQME